MRQGVPVRPWGPAVAVVAGAALVAAAAMFAGGCSEGTRLPTDPGLDLTNSIDTAPPDPTGGEDYEPKRMPGPAQKPATFCQPAYPFRTARFSNPLKIDNQWAPLIPGTQYVLTGVANRGGGLLPHEVIFTVSDVIKTIDGIPVRVLWDRDFNQGQLSEAELAFFAQDDLGTIWSMGEYPEVFDPTSGEFQGAPDTWIAGINGTEAGNWMLGDLRRGKGYYSQGFSAPIEFLDCGTVLQTRLNDCVPVGCFHDVLLIDEYGPYDIAGGHQRKYYAKGVGNIRIGAVNDPEGETLVMSGRRQLNPTELAAVNQAVLDLDLRGHMFNEVYALTDTARVAPPPAAALAARRSTR
jgi:hypothetical protein